MPTFVELQETVTSSKRRSAILHHLIEYIDANFRPIAGGDPKNILVTDDKQKVPFEDFESVIADLLLPEVKECEDRMDGILGASLSVQSVQVAAPQTEPPVAPETPPEQTPQQDEPRRRRRTG